MTLLLLWFFSGWLSKLLRGLLGWLGRWWLRWTRDRFSVILVVLVAGSGRSCYRNFCLGRVKNLFLFLVFWIWVGENIEVCLSRRSAYNVASGRLDFCFAFAFCFFSFSCSHLSLVASWRYSTTSLRSKGGRGDPICVLLRELKLTPILSLFGCPDPSPKLMIRCSASRIGSTSTTIGVVWLIWRHVVMLVVSLVTIFCSR